MKTTCDRQLDLRRLFRQLLLTVICVLALGAISRAQDSGPTDDQRIYAPGSVQDSMHVDSRPAPAVPSDTANKYLWKSDLIHSPTGMLLRSIVVPGWGQWSNGKKWKAGIVFGVETYFFARALIWRSETFDRQHLWEASCRDGDCDITLFNSYKSARNNRNYFYWLTGVTVFISMFDAYADAYLISLERTKDKGDEFWGGHAFLYPEDEYRILATLKF